MENKALQIISQALPPGLTVNATTSITEIVKIDVPAISSLNKGKSSPDAGIALFEACLLDLSIFFGDEWKPETCYSVAHILFDEYYYWTFAELKHFFTKLKAAHFGKIFGSFSPIYVSTAALNYNVDLLESRETYKRLEPKKELELQPGDVGADKVRAALHQLAESLTKDIKAEKDIKIDETVGEGLLAEKRKATVAKNEDKLRELCKIEGWDFDQIFNQFK